MDSTTENTERLRETFYKQAGLIWDSFGYGAAWTEPERLLVGLAGQVMTALSERQLPRTRIMALCQGNASEAQLVASWETLTDGQRSLAEQLRNGLRFAESLVCESVQRKPRRAR
jgi:hypothetical protein